MRSLLQQLPFEILDEIFEKVALSKADSRQTITPILTVSRLFYLLSYRWLLNSLCLLQAQESFVKDFSGQQLLSTRRLLLSFQDLAHLDPAVVSDFLKAIPRLEYLVLYLCETTEQVDLVETIESLKLKVFDYGSFSSVVSIRFERLNTMIRNSAHLTSVSWEVCGVLGEVSKSFNLDGESISSLKTLRITCPAITDDGLMAIMNSCRNSLEVLKIRTTSNSSLLTPRGIAAALSGSKIYSLTLELSTTIIASESLISILSLPLETLSLSSSATSTFRKHIAIDDIARRCHKLKSLTLKGMIPTEEELKIISISKTVLAFPELEKIHLELNAFVDSVEGEESLEMIRASWSERRVQTRLCRRIVAVESS